MTQTKKSIRQHVSTHIQKHHKKYLFISGMAFGAVIVKVLIITAGFLGIMILTGKGNADNEQAKMYQALATFNKIEDIAHQRDHLIHEHMDSDIREGTTGHQWDKDELYHEAEKSFHRAQNLNEKFKATRKFDELIHDQDKYLKIMGYTEIPGADRFDEIEIIFDQIQ